MVVLEGQGRARARARIRGERYSGPLGRPLRWTRFREPAASQRRAIGSFGTTSSSRRHAVSSARASCGIGLRRRWLIEAGACASQDPTRSPRAPALFLRGCPVVPLSLTTTAQQLHRLVFWRSPQEPRSTLSASASCARFPLEHHISPLPSLLSPLHSVVLGPLPAFTVLVNSAQPGVFPPLITIPHCF